MNGKKRRRQCSATRGARYESRAKAEEAILDIKITSAINGARADEGRQSEICLACGGWHVVTRSVRERRGGG